MVKGGLANNHFIGKHSNSPDIDKIIIRFPFKDIWAHIIKSTTIGCSSLLTINSPSKITQFANSLNNKSYTLERTIFSGLISR